MVPKFSLVIPCYNEADNIDPLIKNAIKIIQNPLYEIVLVNNGSEDNTKNKIEFYAKKYANIKIINIRKNIGFGYGVFEGLKNCSGNVIGYTHADLQTDPNDFIKAVDWITKNSNNKLCFVKGSRHSRNLIDVFFTRSMGIFISFIFGTYLHDIGAQPVVFNRELLKKCYIFPNNFTIEIFLYYLAKQNNYLIHRFNVNFPERIYGIGNNDNLNQKFKNSIIVIIESLLLRYKTLFK
jgi:polyisoprenyl-phosphate glycosyltransferase